MTRYRFDPSCRWVGGGHALLGGSPLRLFRLTPTGRRFLARIEAGDDVTATGPAADLLDRLLDAGAIHPIPGPGPFAPGDVTVVIPTHGHHVHATVAALGSVGAVVVVDDGSVPAVVAPPGVEVVRSPERRGPGAARMLGVERARTPLIAFVDADAVPQPGWLEPLLGHFADERVGLVAPRVMTGPAPDSARGPVTRLLARYERVRSPLDLGPVAGRVRARTRVSYVPAAALVLRGEALASVDGFDTSLQVGEDVDLVWRLDEAGWRCRYEPAGVVHHAPRTTLPAWCAQRVAYGRSAGPLARRHPGALAPVAVSGWSAAAWLLAAAGRPRAAVALTGATSLALARKLRAVDDAVPLAVRLAGLGTLAAGRQLASGLTRAWWPLALGAGLVSRRARRAVLAAALVPPLLEWWQRRRSPDAGSDAPLDPVTSTALHLLDDAAYGTGVWLGAWEARTAGPLLPDLTSWPQPGRYERRRAPAPADS